MEQKKNRVINNEEECYNSDSTNPRCVTMFVVISLGGSVINPGSIDVSFLNDFRELLLSEIQSGKKFLIITGGGGVARQYIKALVDAGLDLAEGEKDQLGIIPTWLNARLVATFFKGHAPRVLPSTFDGIIDQLDRYPVVFSGGLLPGVKTDEDAAIFADYLGASYLINITNVDGVYDDNPKTNPDAKKFDRMTYREFYELAEKLSVKAGSNAPFTSIAVKIAERSGIRIFVINKDLDALEAAINGKCHGTEIGPANV
ncbi:MAG: UMP kinase [Candidatus Odinarchaeota archaeon]